LLWLEDRTLPSTLTVLTNADSGPDSLRQAIADAQSGDTITFAPDMRGQTITLTSGELAVSKSLDIEGLGAADLTVSGSDAIRVRDVSGAGVALPIAGLTIAHGRAAAGGGIYVAGGNVNVEQNTLSANQAVGGPGVPGGNGFGTHPDGFPGGPGGPGAG